MAKQDYYKGNMSNMGKDYPMKGGYGGKRSAGGKMSTVKTNSKTEKTFSSPEALYSAGNKGNTVETSLPKHGCPRGAKKTGKRRRGGY